VIAAFIAGMIALFAPCCISVMLPAYFASSFQNRSKLVAMSFIFAAGVATVILPLVMDAVVLRELFVTQHTPVYLIGGSLMLGMVTFTLLGGKLQLPMPGRTATAGAGPISIYSLGMFSGVASSCCAPVLAGVIALSSVAPSAALAAGLGGAYVFGMVAPLFVISLLRDRYDWRTSRLFRSRNVTWRIGSLRRTLSASMLASGLLLGVDRHRNALDWTRLSLDADLEPLGAVDFGRAPARRSTHHQCAFRRAELAGRCAAAGCRVGACVAGASAMASGTA
jgi:cytochrome c-type biogenesis protein